MCGLAIFHRHPPDCPGLSWRPLRAIGLVTGEAGSGKTTVCGKVASSLHPGLYRVFYPLFDNCPLKERQGGTDSLQLTDNPCIPFRTPQIGVVRTIIVVVAIFTCIDMVIVM